MRTTIDLPESVYRKGEQAARTQGVTIEEFIVRSFERELEAAPEQRPAARNVSFPVIRSKHPGTLDLSDFNFDDLLT
ncbi:MAG: hypothetical protein ACRD3N_12680 [Terracidiphilus sp.]